MTRCEITPGQIEAAIANTNIDDDAVRSHYSGRGMYGEECFGIVVDTIRELVEFVIGATLEIPGAEEWLPDVRQDSMGLGTIYYWPSVRLDSQVSA